MAKDEKKLSKSDQRKFMKTVINDVEQQKIKELYKASTLSIFGVDASESIQNADDFAKIFNTVSNVIETNQEKTKHNTFDLLLSLSMQNDKSALSTNGQPNKDIFSQMLNRDVMSSYMEMMNKENNRIQGYKDYKTIYSLIPYVSRSVQAYVDNILSPDDFTKSSLVVHINSHVTEESKNNLEIMKNNMNKLRKDYKIDLSLKDWLIDILRDGEKFILVRKLDDEYNKEILAESVLSHDIFDKYRNNLLIESTDISLTESDKTILKEEFSLSEAEITEIKDKINNKIELYDRDHIVVNDIEQINSYKNNRDKKIKNPLSITKKINTSGVYVKELEIDRVIKITLGKNCLGYYYFELIDDMSANKATDPFNNIFSRINSDNPSNKSKIDVFQKFLSDSISSKIDDKFLKDNEKFKYLILDLIKSKNINKKKIRISYIPPEEITHLFYELKSDGYGKSLLEDAVFYAKLYIATLVSTFMIKLTRSQDRRTFFIETGLSKDVEGIINDFIKSIKSKEIKINDLKSIDTIFNVVSQFQDYFIPVVNGEKAVEIDTIQGQQVDLDNNDFLEYLKKAILVAVGLPASYLGMSDEVDFARSLSMSNGVVLRNIISKQASIGSGMTELMKNIYMLTYPNEINDIIELVEHKFPPPAALNNTNLADQMTNTSSITDALATILLGNGNTDDLLRDRVVLELAKIHLPNIDWESYIKMVEKVKLNNSGEALIKPADA